MLITAIGIFTLCAIPAAALRVRRLPGGSRGCRRALILYRLLLRMPWFTPRHLMPSACCAVVRITG